LYIRACNIYQHIGTTPGKASGALHDGIAGISPQGIGVVHHHLNNMGLPQIEWVE